jgi:hypothetical protein
LDSYCKVSSYYKVSIGLLLEVKEVKSHSDGDKYKGDNALDETRGYLLDNDKANHNED